jgi:hypothetical protein
MQKNNYLEANAENFIGRFRMLTAGIFLFFSCASAWAVTEKEIMTADPKKMLRGIIQACNDNNEKKLYSHFTTDTHRMFNQWNAAEKTRMFHEYCKSFKEDILSAGPLDTAKFYIKKTQFTDNGHFVFKMCLALPGDSKKCVRREGFDVYLENGLVKLDEH